MVTISILIHITVALALPLFRSSLSAIISLMDPSAFLIYVGALSLSALHIQPIGSGIGIGIRSLSTLSQTSQTYWNHFEYNLRYESLSSDSIKNSFNAFWNQVMMQLDDNTLVAIHFKMKFITHRIESTVPMKNDHIDYRIVGLTDLKKGNKKDYDELLTQYLSVLDYMPLEYKEKKEITHLIYSYHIYDGNNHLDKNIHLIKKDMKMPQNINKTEMFSVYNLNLESTSDYTKWGKVLSDSPTLALVLKHKSNLIYHIEKLDGVNKVEIKKDHVKILEYQDSDIINHDTFIRSVGTRVLHYVDGIIKFKTIKRQTTFMQKRSADKVFNKNNIFTMDIETRTINGEMVPFCVCIYDGKKIKSFYLTDYLDSKTMIIHAISYLIKSSNHLAKIYLHNLSNFDGMFLMSILTSIPKIKLDPIMKDGIIYNLKLQWKSDKPNKNGKYATYYIEFRDSLLMLPLSLRKLAKFFGVEGKLSFPFAFVNDLSVPLLYEGITPDLKYYVDLDKAEYDDMIKQNPIWNLKKETIKYCGQDCISLHQVMSKFAQLIYDKWQLNIHKIHTLPSLSMRVWNTHFIDHSEIPIITGITHDNIRVGYTGGHTDMYKPLGTNLKQYDMNSLYPSSMVKFDMPVGTPVFFEGDVTKFKENPFGFFNVTVTAPKDLDRPILQTKVKTKAGWQTVAPLGKWNDMIFSEEMFNAMKYGYTFEIHSGYLFERANLFSNFITELYNLRLTYSKTDPMNLICKLLMNSCYGKFGQQLILPSHIFVTSEGMAEMTSKNELEGKIIDRINEIIELPNEQYLISYLMNQEGQHTIPRGYLNIAIASAISAYSRIQMSSFLADPKYNIYYTDTDCIVMEDDLDPQFIGNDLGKFKLENFYEKGIFLAPKVYAGITKDGKELSKVKGYKHQVPFDNLVSLLKKDASLSLSHDLWMKNLGQGSLKMRHSPYNLKATGNKRHLVYTNNILTGTKPFIINEDKEIISSPKG